jgi:hypothetical protein
VVEINCRRGKAGDYYTGTGSSNRSEAEKQFIEESGQ